MFPDHIACCKQLLSFVWKRANSQALIALDASAFTTPPRNRHRERLMASDIFWIAPMGGGSLGSLAFELVTRDCLTNQARRFCPDFLCDAR